MYAQLVRIKIQRGKAEEAAGIFKSLVLPAAKEREGFQKGYFLVDREGSRATAFAAYDTREHLESLVSSGFFQEQAAKFEGILDGPPEREVYEVAASAP
jgi:quinol monooxygenase YgiN